MNNSNPVATLSHETGIILSKHSNESEIKRYFKKVLELSRSDNEYPVDIDEVWMLVYTRKDSAVDALKKDFIENVDFTCTPAKTGVGSLKHEYRLTVSCMEYFIARKVRSVFEVYRQVFHKTAAYAIISVPYPSYQIEDPITRAERWIEEQKEKLLLESKNEQLEELNDQLVEENNKLAKENLNQKPKVEFANSIMQSNDCISVGEMANILKQNKLFRKGQNAFFEWLRYNGYLICKGIRYNLPTQKSMNYGIMKIAERPYMSKDKVAINKKAVITPYGQQYFLKIFRKNKVRRTSTITLFG